MDLKGRTALVTGASSGIGWAAAQALSARGARVVISSRGGRKLEAAREKLAEGAPAAVEAIAADVREPEELEDLVRAAEDAAGPIDILVANGGGPPSRPATELTDEDWEAAIELCLLFVPRLVRLVLPGMRSRGWGRILAVNSVSARQPIAGLALSNSLRPAVIGYLKTLSAEVAADGVTVNAVLPGYTLTDRQAELAESRSKQLGRPPDEVIAGWAKDIPAGRLAAPEEIGAVLAFLASPAASYVTGQAIAVDGGWVKSLL